VGLSTDEVLGRVIMAIEAAIDESVGHIMTDFNVTAEVDHTQ
jgi:hypothetical protein